MNFKALSVLLIVLIGLCGQRGVNSQEADNPNLKPTLLNLLRDQYLTTEDTLWAMITSGQEPSYVLQQIHSGHSRFLGQNFNVIHCYLSTFDPEQRTVHDALLKISNQVNQTMNRYLHTSRRLYNEEESLDNARENHELSKQLDIIYDTTGLGDFYFTLKRVRFLIFYIYLRNFCDNSLQGHK